MNVSTGTLRRMYRRFKKPGSQFESMFKPADSFKKWVKLNVRVIQKYCKHRCKKDVPYTDAAAALLS